MIELEKDQTFLQDSIPSQILKKLKGFGISDIEIKSPIKGAVVTAYPIFIKGSTPIQKILSKDEDLALACNVESVVLKRIGNEILVYVPNEEREIVDFKDALFWYLNDKEVKKEKLPLLLGIDTKGKKSTIDLSEQPHILIAGSTGSGKSIFEANIISALSMLFSSDDLKLYLVDTKRLDLPLFKSLPHVEELATDVKDYYSLISILSGEVEKRNRLLERNSVRNILEYNNLFPDKKLPYIVLVIDELADLIDRDNWLRKENGKQHTEQKVTDSLRRLIQICRASGCHIIACTQRTSVDVVSGMIKANFPTRISLKLPSAIDSRVILDSKGAESLLGKGDMLIKKGDSDSLERFHSPFVRIEDIRMILSQREMILEQLLMKG